MKKQNIFERIAQGATIFAGSTTAFIIALSIILIWLISGPIFNFSNTWQLIINTGTTILTFLMVFLIQRTQNKDSKAVHLKLNELVAALKGPSNRLVDVEDLSEEELDTLGKYYKNLAKLAKKERDLTKTHSIEESHKRHKSKYSS